jgi:AAA domain (dynein-related subfamily)
MKLSEANEQLMMSFQLKSPCMLWGAPGMGKSQLIWQLIAMLGCGAIDKRLSQMDPTDVQGLPSDEIINKCKFMGYSIPKWLPDAVRDGPTGILFLDEINLAPQTVQAAAYELILDRRLGDYTLPDGWVVFAAGNRMEDKTNVNRMGRALTNRFKNCEVEVDLQEWKDHARKMNVEAQIIALMTWKPDLLLDQEVKTVAWPSPRTWFMYNDHWPLVTTSNDFNTCASIVGKGAAGEMIAFKQTQALCPTPEQVEQDPMSAIVPVGPGAQHCITGSLSAAVTEDNFAPYLKYMCRLGVEFQTVFMHDTPKVCEEVSELPPFTKWLEANHNLII